LQLVYGVTSPAGPSFLRHSRSDPLLHLDTILRDTSDTISLRCSVHLSERWTPHWSSRTFFNVFERNTYRFSGRGNILRVRWRGPRAKARTCRVSLLRKCLIRVSGFRRAGRRTKRNFRIHWRKRSILPLCRRKTEQQTFNRPLDRYQLDTLSHWDIIDLVRLTSVTICPKARIDRIDLDLEHNRSKLSYKNRHEAEPLPPSGPLQCRLHCSNSRQRRITTRPLPFRLSSSPTSSSLPILGQHGLTATWQRRDLHPSRTDSGDKHRSRRDQAIRHRVRTSREVEAVISYTRSD
jgi:hypothetical protein